MFSIRRTTPAPLLIVVLACSSNGASSAPSPDASTGAPSDQDSGAQSVGDAGGLAEAGAGVDKAANCASTFGSALTNAFGRLDGTVVAVVPPTNSTCAMPNSTHLVIQVLTGGAAYRMVVDVLSNRGNPDVFFGEIDAPLAAGPWAEGWHAGVALDYVSTLGVHSGSFSEMHEADLVAKITSEIDLGARISVFATSGDGRTESAHLVHRNATNADGAIVLRPDSEHPHYVLLRFDEQSF